MPMTIGTGLPVRVESTHRSLPMKISTLPQYYRNVARWQKILAVLSKYGLADWISGFELEFAKGILKDRDGAALARHTREARIRLAMTELGPTFIKLGQVLSTRPDLIGVPLADELTHLQADVPPDPLEVVRATIESELGQPLDEVFADVDDVPIGSASIGQCHRATLISGEHVVVKVQRSGIMETVRVDLEIMAGLATLAEGLPDFVNYRPRAVVAEFQRMLLRELDFGREERNMQQFAQDFAGSKTVRIPKSYPDLCTGRVLTMECLEGVKLADTEMLGAAGFDLEEIARRGADMYLQMIFGNGFYHADPHPGNLLLLEGNIIGLLDFGMVGRIDSDLQEQIEEMFLAITNVDAERLTLLITRIGQVPPQLDYAGLSLEISDFVAFYGNQPLDSLNLAAALNEMTEIIRRFHIMLPARISLLIKVFVMLDGTARKLSPRFSLLEIMQPYRKKMAWRRVSPVRRMKKMQRIYGELEYLAQNVPRRIGDIVQQLQTGKFDVHLDHRGLEPSVNRLVLGMLASALFLGSSVLITHKVLAINGISILGYGGAIISLFLSLRLLHAINKSGHLDRRD
jgi:ubiquinone biosynthesis protein